MIEATKRAIFAKSSAVPEITVIIWNPIGTMTTPKTAIPKIITGNIRCRLRRASFTIKFKNDRWLISFSICSKSHYRFYFTWLLKDKAYSMRIKDSTKTIDCLIKPREIFWWNYNITPCFCLSFRCFVVWPEILSHFWKNSTLLINKKNVLWYLGSVGIRTNRTVLGAEFGSTGGVRTNSTIFVNGIVSTAVISSSRNKLLYFMHLHESAHSEFYKKLS